MIYFKPLSRDDVARIVDIAVVALSRRLEDQRLTVEVTDAARDYIRESAYDPIYGARPIKRFISSRLETLIAKTIIKDDVAPDSVITVDYDGSLTCKVK
jgi:ATP-dependent Clp protease ATP-binding subunit ClpB